MRKSVHVFMALGAVLASLLFGGGCADVRELSGVYVEVYDDDRVPDTRAYALRVTSFEFEMQVGGWVEYYAQNELNSAAFPYASPTYCAYFGPFRRSDRGMVVRAAGPSPDEDLQLRFEQVTRRLLSARVESGGGIFVEGEDAAAAALAFQVADETPGAGCPAEAALLDRPLTGLGARVGGAP